MKSERKINDLSIHSFKDKDFHRLVELSQTTYPGREISNSEYLSWQYLNNPDGEAVISVGEKEGKIISQYIVLPRLFSIGNKLMMGSLSANTLTHPDYRGHGLFTTLAGKTFEKCYERDIMFTIGFPNSQSHPVIEKENIFQTKGYLPLLVKFIHPLNAMAKFIFSKKIKSGKEINLNLSSELFPEKVSVFDFSKDAGKYEIFLNKFNAEKKNVTNRSLIFMQWRYEKIPIRKYVLIKIEVEGNLVGLAVFRAKNVYGIRCGIVVDLIMLDGEGKKPRLLNCIHRIAVVNKLDLIFTTVPDTSSEFSELKKASYFSIPIPFLPQKLAFIIRRHSQDVSEDVADFKKWFLTFGDYDIF